MKMTKRIFSLALALIMMMCLATSAFAVDVTIQGEKTGHTYEAYQIFSGDITGDKFVNAAWGSSVKSPDALTAALVAAGLLAAGDDTVDEVVAALSKIEDKTDKADLLASIIGKVDGEGYAYLSNPVKTVTNTDGTSYTFTGLEEGYYLIMDKKDTVDDKHDFNTKYLLALTNDTQIAVKGNVPTSDKTVSDKINGTYTEYISNQLNKVHYYRWVGTMPSDLDDYSWYYYEFQDTLSAGLTFGQIEQIYIETNSGTKIWIMDKTGQADAEAKVATGNPDATAHIHTEMLPTITSSSNSVKMVWNDLKATYPGLLSDDKVIVKYSATLNESAIIGADGNENTLELIFSNDPHDNSEKGKTPPSIPRVYSFALQVFKYYQNGTTKAPLSGAEFVLYHNHTENAGESNEKIVPVYAVIHDGNIVSWTETKADASKITSGTDGLVTVDGLKEYTDYYLEETKAPDGYNAITRHIKITINDYTVDANGNITDISYEIDGVHGTEANVETGVVKVNVENKTGTVLPQTGGVGTTLFYVFGGLMVAVAVVLLVTKRRMAKEN